MRIGLISDTHGRLRPKVFEAFEGVERILHAGDVGPPEILIDLAAIAPVTAVHGNTDGWELHDAAQAEARLELAGRSVVLTHGHLLGAPTPVNLHAAYPDADIIIYGHTHRAAVDRLDGALIVNPGAAGPPRFNLPPSVAILEIGEDGEGGGGVEGVEGVEGGEGGEGAEGVEVRLVEL